MSRFHVDAFILVAGECLPNPHAAIAAAGGQQVACDPCSRYVATRATQADTWLVDTRGACPVGLCSHDTMHRAIAPVGLHATCFTSFSCPSSKATCSHSSPWADVWQGVGTAPSHLALPYRGGGIKAGGSKVGAVWGPGNTAHGAAVGIVEDADTHPGGVTDGPYPHGFVRTAAC